MADTKQPAAAGVDAAAEIGKVTAEVARTAADAGRQVVTLASDRTQEAIRGSQQAVAATIKGLGDYGLPQAGQAERSTPAAPALVPAVVDEMAGLMVASMQHAARYMQAWLAARTFEDLAAAQSRYAGALIEETVGRGARIAALSVREAIRTVDRADAQRQRQAA